MLTLNDKKILFVEDEPLVARATAQLLEGMGAVVIGPAKTLAEGVALARAEDIDAAILDFSLRGEPSALIAEELRAREIPFIVATGYDVEDIELFDGAALILKPYTAQSLQTALLEAMKDKE